MRNVAKVVVGDLTITVERSEPKQKLSPPDSELVHEAKRTRNREHADYAAIREAIRKISVGSDGHAPLTQTHEEALHTVEISRLDLGRYRTLIDDLGVLADRGSSSHLSYEDASHMLRSLASQSEARKLAKRALEQIRGRK